MQLTKIHLTQAPRGLASLDFDCLVSLFLLCDGLGIIDALMAKGPLTRFHEMIACALLMSQLPTAEMPMCAGK
jgi:hypothetical protein